MKGIRDNRTMEKEARRKEEAFLLSDVQTFTEPIEEQVIVEESTSVQVSSKVQLLRQKQKEKLNRARINGK